MSAKRLVSSAVALIAALQSLTCMPPPAQETKTICGSEVALEASPSDGCEGLRHRSNSHDDINAPPSGLELCDGGSIDRYAAASCPLCYDVKLCDSGDAGCGDGCSSGETCVAGEPSCECMRLCTAPSDCAFGETCACPFSDSNDNVSFPRCVPAQCSTNEDCGPDGRCGLSAGACGGIQGFFCRSNVDECAGNGQCTDGEVGFDCRFDTDEGRFRCGQRADC